MSRIEEIRSLLKGQRGRRDLNESDIIYLLKKLDEAKAMAEFYASPWGAFFDKYDKFTSKMIQFELNVKGEKARDFLKGLEDGTQKTRYPKTNRKTLHKT